MAGMIRRFKEDEIAWLKIFKGYVFSLPYLGFRCPWYNNIKSIFVNSFYKSGAVDSLTAGSTQSMTGTFPTTIFLKYALFDFVCLRLFFSCSRLVQIRIYNHRLFLICRA